MLWDLLITDWQGTAIVAACLVGVFLAAVYVPSPAKSFVVTLLILVAVVSKVYSLGYSAAEAVGNAKLQALVDHYNVETEKAVAAAAERARAEGEANAALVRQQLDAQAAQAESDAKAYQQAIEVIGKAGQSADEVAPDLILRAIRGAK